MAGSCALGRAASPATGSAASGCEPKRRRRRRTAAARDTAAGETRAFEPRWRRGPAGRGKAPRFLVRLFRRVRLPPNSVYYLFTVSGTRTRSGDNGRTRICGAEGYAETRPQRWEDSRRRRRTEERGARHCASAPSPLDATLGCERANGRTERTDEQKGRTTAQPDHQSVTDTITDSASPSLHS